MNVTGLPPGRPVEPLDRVGERVRCFVTRIEAPEPAHSRLAALVTYTADHAYGTFHGTFWTKDGSRYELGQVLWVTIERDR